MKHTPLLLLCLLTACATPQLNTWQTLTIAEGKHRATPYAPTWNDDTTIIYEWTFDESAKYDLGDQDQCDWNKLTGRSFHKITNHKDAIMAAWRWDFAGYLWVAPYYHEGGNTWWAKTKCSQPQSLATDPNLVAIRLGIGETLRTIIQIDERRNWAKITLLNMSSTEVSAFEMVFPTNIRNSREIYPWFGGNEAAPQDIIIYRKRL